MYLTRELSWLEFNDRVLAQACDASHPLLERVKFLAISAANLDEFFMVRIPAASRRPPADGPRLTVDTPGRGSLRDVFRRAQRMLEDQAHVWHDLRRALADADIHVTDRSEWTPAQRASLARHFEHEVAPALTPLVCEPRNEGPAIPSRGLNLFLSLRNRGQRRHVRISIPSSLTRLVPIAPTAPARARTVAFALLEDVIREHAAALFPGAVVEGVHAFRVLRDTDLRVDHFEVPQPDRRGREQPGPATARPDRAGPCRT